jgi:hypothetical protein
MSEIKNNLAKDNLAFTFDVVSKVLAGGIETSVVDWHSSLQSKSADDVLTDKSEGPKRREAKDFLLAMLANGPVDGSDVKAKASELGISPATLGRACLNLKVSYSFTGPKSLNWSLAEAE